MLRVIGDAEHSRYPVCRGGLDDVLGVITAQKLLRRAIKGEAFAVDQDLQPPVFVPETLSGMELLEHFRALERAASSSSSTSTARCRE